MNEITTEFSDIDFYKEEIPTKTGEDLFDLRKKLSLTTDQMGRLFDMSRTTYWRLETGRRELSLPSPICALIEKFEGFDTSKIS